MKAFSGVRLGRIMCLAVEVGGGGVDRSSDRGRRSNRVPCEVWGVLNTMVSPSLSPGCRCFARISS